MNDAKQPFTAAQEMQKRSAEARWRKISPEQRSEMMRRLARKSATARKGKFTKEQRSEMMRKLAHRRWAAVDAKKD
jgi:acyl-CoA reductase-like NAD-dependent aldehyde dehydrogenase